MSAEKSKDTPLREGTTDIDYAETGDITRVHSAVEREHADPVAGVVPVPIWLMCICAVVGAWAFFYFGMFFGGFRGDVFDEQESSPKLLASSKVDKSAAESAMSQGEAADSPMAQGKRLFNQNCASCHQPTGQGIPGQYPPLVGSDWVTGSSKRLSLILLKGLQGPITVNGVPYNGAMPAQERTLTDKKLAAVMTYIRKEWGNQGSEVSPEQVATEADLLAIPADAPLEPAPAPEVQAAPPPGQ
jgi:mono/diheme cytochrome c family protein